MYQLSADAIRDVLDRAETRRRAMLSSRTVDAWRWINGAGDNAPPGLTIDRYGSFLVVGAREHLDEETISAWTNVAIERAEPRGVVLKRLATTVQKSTSAWIAGTPADGAVKVREDDATFLCDLDDGISTGLFLDQREARKRIRDFASDREVLNLFAYTCAFSVHAALAGARRATSIDVSKKALRRGRENMIASGLDADRHRWFGDDVFAFLARQRKKEAQYGLVIADPPVFGHARGATFSLERELPVLLEGCVLATAPDGVLLFSTHLLSIDEAALFEAARTAAFAAGRSVALVETMGMPEWDHPASSAADDRGNYLKTLVLRVA